MFASGASAELGVDGAGRMVVRTRSARDGTSGGMELVLVVSAPVTSLPRGSVPIFDGSAIRFGSVSAVFQTLLLVVAAYLGLRSAAPKAGPPSFTPGWISAGPSALCCRC